MNLEKFEVISSWEGGYTTLRVKTEDYKEIFKPVKYFKVWSDYDIGDEDLPNILYIKADKVDKVHHYLGDYCDSCGLEYNEELRDGMFEIEEIELSDVFVEL